MQSGDLASTPDCEKDSLLGLTAPMQNLFKIFEITVFLESPFIYIWVKSCRTEKKCLKCL